MKTPNGTRVGSKMAMVAAFVAYNEGCSMLDAAAAVGPHGSLNYGYRAVHRARRSGMIVARPSSKPQRKYDLYSISTAAKLDAMDATEGPLFVAPCGWCGAHEGYDTTSDGWERCNVCKGC